MANRDRSRSPMNGGRRGGMNASDRIRAPSDRRVYVANIPFDMKWNDLKDLFRREVGDVSFVHLFEDENGKFRGCGIVEFKEKGSVPKALEKLHRYEIDGRFLVVKEDFDVERDAAGRPLTGGRRRERSRSPRRGGDRYRDGGRGGQSFNTYGLSPQFLEALGIEGPLVSKIFVANLDYKVDEKKMREIFRIAGRILDIELNMDKDGNSKGHGTVEFSHPVEAVQAISMFNNQKLYGRTLMIRMDKMLDEEGAMPKIPAGLSGIGKGLGPGGAPLKWDSSMNSIPQMNNPPPAPNAAAALTSVLGQAANPAAANVAAALGGLTGLGALGGLAGLSDRLNGAAGLAGLSNSILGQLAGAAAGGANAASAVRQPTSSLTGGMGGLGGGLGGGMGGPGVGGDRQSSMDGYGGHHNMKPMSGGYPPSDTIIVNNLPPSMSWQMLRDRFAEVGNVQYAELKGHGSGIVRFQSDRDAARAVDMMNGMRLDNRPIEVRFF